MLNVTRAGIRSVSLYPTLKPDTEWVSGNLHLMKACVGKWKGRQAGRRVPVNTESGGVRVGKPPGNWMMRGGREKIGE